MPSDTLWTPVIWTECHMSSDTLWTPVINRMPYVPWHIVNACHMSRMPHVLWHIVNACHVSRMPHVPWHIVNACRMNRMPHVPWHCERLSYEQNAICPDTLWTPVIWTECHMTPDTLWTPVIWTECHMSWHIVNACHMNRMPHVPIALQWKWELPVPWPNVTRHCDFWCHCFDSLYRSLAVSQLRVFSYCGWY
jgi:hypothetical protein